MISLYVHLQYNFVVCSYSAHLHQNLIIFVSLTDTWVFVCYPLSSRDRKTHVFWDLKVINIFIAYA